MSASKDKKLRATQRMEGTERRQVAHSKEQKKHKLRLTRGIIIGAVVVIVLALSILITSSLPFGMTAVSVAGRDYTTSEFNYFYFSSYYSTLNHLGSYASYFLDTKKPLSQQQSVYDQTMSWSAYFQNAALDQMKTISILLNAADAEGITLSDDGKANIEAQITSLRSSAESAGYTNATTNDANFKLFLTARYGKYFTVDTLRDILGMTGLASEYYTHKMDTFTFTQDQLDSYYSENKDTMDLYTYRAYFISGAADDANGIDAATALANAKKTADTIVAAVTGDDAAARETAYNNAVYQNAPDADKSTYQDGTKTLNNNTAGSSVSADYSAWLFDSARKAGDVTAIASADTNPGYYVVMFLSREDNHYPLREARHILIMAQAGSDGTYSDAAKAAAQTQAQALLDQWKAGAATEDSFAELAKANSQDQGSAANGGLYDKIYKGEMVTAFNDWVFDPARKPGDTTVVYGESSNYAGYHAIYYVGENTELYSTLLARNAMQSQAYKDWMTAQSDGVTLVTHSLPMYFAR